MPQHRPAQDNRLAIRIEDVLETTNDWMTIGEVAERLGALSQTVYKTVLRGLRFPHERRTHPATGHIQLRIAERTYLRDDVA